jgi:pimeloyl-ACP methyl ester carboxylesterase
METTEKGRAMEAPTTRILTPARIVALALIAALIGGLMYARFGPDSGPVSVPDGAKAGDLVLEQCDYATEDGAYEADCGTLVVPENRADPQSRLIALPVTRIHAQSDDPAEPIFRLEGGPGVTNMKFSKASRFAGERDVVLVGYRGVDGSSRLDCPEVESALKRSTDFLAESSFRRYADAFRSCADRLTDEGVDLAGYSLGQRVDDLEAARVALGYDRVDLLSESAGTRTAMIYSWRYPESVHRSVMIGANPPGHFLWDPRTTDEQIGRYAALCSQDGACADRTDDLAASMRETATDIPDRWWFLPIEEGNVRLGAFYGLMESTADAGPLNGPAILDSWLAADDGDQSGFWLSSVMGKYSLAEAWVWGDLAAASRADVAAAREYFSSGEHRADSILGNPATEFMWAGGRLLDAWPATPGDDEYSRMQTSEVETLVVGGTLDFSTPPQAATEELLPYLPNGHQVVLAGFGHTTDFWTQQPEAGSRLINTFLDSGRVDDSLYEPRTVDFTPGLGHGWIAKIVIGVMLALATLTVLSLLRMPFSVRRRAAFGPKAGAAMRSLYASVLGVGGWVVGALIVITTMPGVPLDDELLAVLSAGVPVGLAVYWGWVHRDWPAERKRLGLAAAAAGALAGAWLGFQATDDLLAILAAIGGAVAGANLTLILLDMARIRSVDDEVAAGTTVDALRPSLEPAAPTGAGRS